jgi:hypothetical protein
VELRGFEPLALSPEIGSELRIVCSGVVTSVLAVQRICTNVLRDATVLDCELVAG